MIPESAPLMCRMSALAATALALSLAASPAMAKPPKAAPAVVSTAAAPDAPRPASAEERSLAARLDPLARAAFWGRESDLDPRDAPSCRGTSWFR